MTEEEREALELKRILGNIEDHGAAKSKLTRIPMGPPDSQKTYLTDPCKICGNPYRYINSNACTLRDRHP